MEIYNFVPRQEKQMKLIAFKTNDTGGLKKKNGKSLLKKNKKQTRKLHSKLFAKKERALLVVIQAMDAAGKNSTIKHVFNTLNPAGLQVHEFTEPTSNEQKHDYLWRLHKALPEKGQIAIFNRSYYEEVITTKVHPEYLLDQKIPGVKNPDYISEEFWKARYEQIRNYEKYLIQNGTEILKFFLHISYDKQRKRFLRRINRNDKHWKFEIKDVYERKHWDAYQQAYEKCITETHTKIAPW